MKSGFLERAIGCLAVLRRHHAWPQGWSPSLRGGYISPPRARSPVPRSCYSIWPSSAYSPWREQMQPAGFPCLSRDSRGPQLPGSGERAPGGVQPPRPAGCHARGRGMEGIHRYSLLRDIYFRAPRDPASGAILGGSVPQSRGPGMTKLREADLVCAQILTAQCGRSVRSAAQELGVSESTLRYRLQRRAEGAVDGRRCKPEACAAHDRVIHSPLATAMPIPPRWPRERDWERMVTFYDFPEAHGKHLRTTNPVESPFASVRLRTNAGNRYKRVQGDRPHLASAEGGRATIPEAQRTRAPARCAY